jgi:hypothetical protein
MEFPARAHVKGRPKFWSEKPKTPATRAGIFGQREEDTPSRKDKISVVYWNGADRLNPLEALGMTG